ncbi:RCC1 and BTB domain-containing protein 1-like isoform X4 [Planococcus citri]|uniref:RCC1 and BTB domain-containing protein 1-like isoform X4 n=1 Tax=Planococcus citri TaxID=170843 RepID=UPI0031F95DA4
MDLIQIPYFTSLSNEFVKAIDRVWVSDKRVLIITKKDEVYGMGEGLMADSSQKCDNIHEPKAISCLNGKKVKDFIIGEEFVIAVNEDGRLFSWGANDSGQLGLGNCGTTYTPTLISSLSSETITKVARKDNTVHALSDKGKLFSWGQFLERVPVKSSKLTDRVTDIALVTSNILMLFSKYRSFCVDDNKLKSIYEGTVLFDNVKNIVCGSSHLLALKHDGTLYSTGYNEKGQLGIGIINKECVNECVRVLNISEKIIEIATVLDTCAAKTESNQIYVWGACRGQIVPSPFLTSYATFNEVFLNCSESNSFKTYGALKLSSIMKSTKNTQNDHLEIIKLIVDFDEPSKSSDFTIVVEEKQIFVHKEVLRQRSEYFKTMLNESWSENNKNVLRVNDFTYEAFKIYLQYLYGMDINVTPENVMDLLMIAHRYMDGKLKNLIKEKIEGDEFMEMSVDSANKILEFPPQAFKITSGLFKYMTYPSQ